MSEEMQRPEGQPAAQVAGMAPGEDPVSRFFDAMASAIGVDRVFGEPVRAGDRVVIPVAETSMGGGAGYGRGTGDGEGEARGVRFGVGGGGGGGATTRAVAVVIAEPGGVTVRPIVDVGKLALSGLANVVGLWKGAVTFAQVLRKRR
ncbi:MAG: spore germination protein GerW family protein [Anaerolineae bacterium]|nr:spore germination protein GerW family protein [Anaerolineae bacterium]